MRLINADELLEHVWREDLDTREKIANLVERMHTASDWSRFSTKLWKEAYERGKRDAQPEPLTDKEQDLSEQLEKAREELENAKSENAQQMKAIEILRKELARACGTIEGLKFAVRCNGVSGGEVR